MSHNVSDTLEQCLSSIYFIIDENFNTDIDPALIKDRTYINLQSALSELILEVREAI